MHFTPSVSALKARKVSIAVQVQQIVATKRSLHGYAGGDGARRELSKDYTGEAASSIVNTIFSKVASIP